MNALASGSGSSTVVVRIARHVEPARLQEALLVTVAGQEPHHHLVARLEPLPVQLDLARWPGRRGRR
jgi:hypothetical protein